MLGIFFRAPVLDLVLPPRRTTHENTCFKTPGKTVGSVWLNYSHFVFCLYVRVTLEKTLDFKEPPGRRGASRDFGRLGSLLLTCLESQFLGSQTGGSRENHRQGKRRPWSLFFCCWIFNSVLLCPCSFNKSFSFHMLEKTMLGFWVHISYGRGNYTRLMW